jgi:hypothetical protein
MENKNFGRPGRAPSLRFMSWHLPYNWGKSTENPSNRVVENCPDIPVAAVQYTFTHKQYSSTVHIYTQTEQQYSTHLRTNSTAVQYTFTHKQNSSTVHIYTQTVQQYSTHLHTNSTHLHKNSTQNTDNGTYITIKRIYLGSAGRAPSLWFISWHLSFNWGKIT